MKNGQRIKKQKIHKGKSYVDYKGRKIELPENLAEAVPGAEKPLVKPRQISDICSLYELLSMEGNEWFQDILTTDESAIGIQHSQESDEYFDELSMTLLQKEDLPPKARFRALVRMVLANVAWLGDVEDEELTDNVARNIVILRQKKKTDRVLTLHEKAMLLKPAATRTKEEKHALRECIKGLKCFRRYPKNVKKKLSEVIYYLYYGPGRIILKQGHPAEKMYFIISGEVTLAVTGYDEILQKTVTHEIAVLYPGSAFGELTLLTKNIRTATCTTRTTCELLCVTKEDFENVLEGTIRKSWTMIEQYMRMFPYFETWDTFSTQRMCMSSQINEYKPKKIILGCGYGHLDNGYFVVKGQCALINELKIVFKMGYKGLYPSRLYSEDTLLDQNERVKSVFVHSCTFLPGALFGFGTDMEDRTIISLNSVTCLTAPLDMLLQSKNTNYIWQRMIHYLEKKLPSRKMLFKSYLEQHSWLNYRSELVHSALVGKQSPSTTSRSDVPYFYRLTEDLMNQSNF